MDGAREQVEPGEVGAEEVDEAFRSCRTGAGLPGISPNSL
jgi:hypothetical protein